MSSHLSRARLLNRGRQRPFARSGYCGSTPSPRNCVALVVSPQGCRFRASQALPLETPVRLNDLTGGGSLSARVATCPPLGNDGRYFLPGVALDNHGNVWGIAAPPEDWNCTPNPGAASA